MKKLSKTVLKNISNRKVPQSLKVPNLMKLIETFGAHVQ